MAGDWIPMRTDLWECPEVVRLLSAICPDSVRDPSKAVREKSKIIGALFRTWSLFDTYTDDGILHGYTAEVLNSAVGIDGWAENLQHIGWLSINEQSLSMPGFETWLSSSAKARLKDAQRKRNSRKDASESCPKPVRKSADKNRTTGEERTGEISNTTHTPRDAGNSTPSTVEGSSPDQQASQLRTWKYPQCASEKVRASIDRWQAYRIEACGRPDGDAAIEGLVGYSMQMKWTDDQVDAAVTFSIAKKARTWYDPANDFNKPLAARSPTATRPRGAPPAEQPF